MSRSNFIPPSLMRGLKEHQRTVAEAIAKGEPVPEFHPTVVLGLVTEVDCFKAIKEMGDTKFYLKALLQKEMEKPVDEKSKKEISKLTAAIQQVHSNQLIVINDVCKRFEVIHPLMKDLDPKLVEKRRPYWVWYAECHKKVYGEEIKVLNPEVSLDPPKEGDS